MDFYKESYLTKWKNQVTKVARSKAICLAALRSVTRDIRLSLRGVTDVIENRHQNEWYIQCYNIDYPYCVYPSISLNVEKIKCRGHPCTKQNCKENRLHIDCTEVGCNGVHYVWFLLLEEENILILEKLQTGNNRTNATMAVSNMVKAVAVTKKRDRWHSALKEWFANEKSKE